MPRYLIINTVSFREPMDRLRDAHVVTAKNEDAAMEAIAHRGRYMIFDVDIAPVYEVNEVTDYERRKVA